jgi:uracil-DNA glycosylase
MVEEQDQIKLEASWKKELLPEFQQPYMTSLRAFLAREKRAGKEIYPRGADMFNAFNLTPFDKVKVVILGQDPYHGPGQAHGLCFSVLPGMSVPPSLINIYKEIHRDLGIVPPRHGHLVSWAKQGVLLLNSVLSVEKKRAGSHQKQGWEQFTDRAVTLLNQGHEGLVFLLWGSYAQNKGQFIDTRRHLVLKSAHPSPLSAHRGFLGNGHFSRANHYLAARGKKGIDWRLSEDDGPGRSCSPGSGLP